MTRAVKGGPLPLSAEALKKRQVQLAEAQRRFQEKVEVRLRERAERLATQPTPRYDEVFDAGIRYLDELAGR